MDAQQLAPSGDLLLSALALTAGFLGGLVRGYSGFGFALAAVPMLSLGVPPALAVPSVLIHELGIGLLTISRERKFVSWPILKTLAAGSVVGSPVGLAFLWGLPADYMRLIIGVAVAISVCLIWLCPAIEFRLKPRRLLLAGIASGLLNGGTAMSGPPAVILLLGSGLPAQSVRGVLVFFIVISAMIAVSLTLIFGMQSLETARVALWMLPGVAAGVPLGSYLFAALPTTHYRRISLLFLMLVSLLSVTASISAFT